MSKAIEDIIRERARQIDEEQFDHAHDDQHEAGELAAAAACYANPLAIVVDGSGLEIGQPNEGTLPLGWPEDWAAAWWKPGDDRRNLVKAATLIVAEIERLDRAAMKLEAAQ